MERAKIYPLNLPEADRKPMQFPNASGVPANMLPRSDFSAFEQLKWLIDREGTNLADRDGLGILANVGLVRGAPFKPDAETKAMLDAAAKTGYKMSRAIGMMPSIGGRDYHVWQDRKWLNPVNNHAEPGPEKTMDLSFLNKEAGFTEVVPRVWFSTDYYSISPGIGLAVAGQRSRIPDRICRCRW